MISTSITVLLCLTIGFVAGYLAQNSAPKENCGWEISEMGNSPDSSNHLEEYEKMQDITLLGSKEYACNTLSAFEKLTSLHGRTLALETRQRTGEANRVRTATIKRKVGEARAAESSFRQCVQKMVPELLISWDEKASRNELRFNEKHEDANGISLEVLQQTADALENSM
tara:strand:+ start:2580 stop:3089 length:510 start_codon:yes stop_codon:yes gene_type:complete